jgi:hypothetical protein
MHSPGYIRQLQQEAAERACATQLQPYVAFDRSEVESWPPFPFPELGDFIPHGWELEAELFCDASGLGSPGEPALTAEQFKARALQLRDDDPGVGFAIRESGQFQLYVGVYRRSVDN